MKKVKLFCLPHAGGSAMLYQSWKKHLKNEIELIPVELAGRGKRINEPLYDSVQEIVEDIYTHVEKDIEGSDYALFGHSMGTILVYELARKIRKLKQKEPVHVFFSGRYPPYAENEEREILHNLPDDQFMLKIFEHGGTSKEVINNKEIMDIFLPILRADYKLVETHQHKDDIFKFNCNITALNGKLDKYVPSKYVQRWQECTKGKLAIYEFDDGHFFINKFKEDVSNIINKTLQEHL